MFAWRLIFAKFPTIREINENKALEIKNGVREFWSTLAFSCVKDVHHFLVPSSFL